MEAGLSQEKPEQLVSNLTCIFPKIPHYASLLILKFHILFTLLPGRPP